MGIPEWQEIAIPEGFGPHARERRSNGWIPPTLRGVGYWACGCFCGRKPTLLTAGMMSPDTSDGFRMVNHQLARMDLPTGDIHKVSHLQGTFF